jgi:F-type H+-transporting ATPase subunit delta
VPDRRRAWARALFLAAPDQAARAAYGDALEALEIALEREPRLHEFLSNPAIGKEAKSSLIAAALEKAGSQASVVFGRFCSLIIEKGRAPLLVKIAHSYGALRDADEGIARLEVEAAREVDSAALERIAQAWAKYSGAKTTRTSVRLNPNLIAGYRLRAGSLRIDYSIAGRLERLKAELARPLGKSSASAGGLASGGAARGEG